MNLLPSLPTLRTAGAVRTARVLVVGIVMLLALAVALPAFAHVSVRTDNPTPGGFAVYTVRVPNERDDAGTTTVEVQMPDGFEASRYRPVDGWDISLEDGVLTIQGGTIEAGQYQDFSFQARNPEEAGLLRFAAIQSYDSGEVVEWTGEEGSETPAAMVELVAAEGEAAGDSHGAADATEEAGEGGAAADATEDDATAGDEDDDDENDDDGGSSSLSIVALILGVVGVGLGGAALMRSRG